MVKLYFLVTFQIIVSYIFPEYFFEISSAVQKIWRLSSILIIFVNFLDFFDISLIIFWHICFQLYWKDTRTQEKTKAHIIFRKIYWLMDSSRTANYFKLQT